MLVFQTFEDTSLTDITSHTQVKMAREKIASLAPVQSLNAWARDPVTLQPWTHVLAEPLLQLGPRGPIITVERHCLIVIGGMCLSGYLQLLGYSDWAKYARRAVYGFMITVRSVIWLLMNGK